MQHKPSIGLDVGDKRIGVATSDALGMFAHPTCSLERADENQCLGALERLVTEQSAAAGMIEIVIGLPLELSGKEGEQVKKVRSFGEKLCAHLKSRLSEKTIELVYWDERLTSVQAERALAGSRLKDKSRREALDRISAVIILQSYLDSKSSPSFSTNKPLN